MNRSLFAAILQNTGPLSSCRPESHPPPGWFSIRVPSRFQRLSEDWVTKLIYLAAAAQAINLLAAIHVTQRLGYQDVLLSVFETWGVAVPLKLLALGLWLNYREYVEARLVAWLIAPLSVYALLHDLLLLT
jgi:hypothetical protein